jgi:hypothetical protein
VPALGYQVKGYTLLSNSYSDYEIPQSFSLSYLIIGEVWTITEGLHFLSDTFSFLASSLPFLFLLYQCFLGKEDVKRL